MESNAHRPILFFDGECNLCNRFIQFVIKHERRPDLLFAPLQSPPGEKAKQHVAKKGIHPDTIILLANGKYYTHSTAALNIARLMGGIWSLAYAAIIVPPFLRNAVYRFIAKRRYSWFGRRAACMVPTPELAARFLMK